MPQTLWFFFAFVTVLALIGLAAWLVRRFAGNRLGAGDQSRPHAPPRCDRCRRGRWPPPAGAGPPRQCRTSADDRRADRHRRRAQHRSQRARSAIRSSARLLEPNCRRGWRRKPDGRGRSGRMSRFEHREPASSPEPPPRAARATLRRRRCAVRRRRCPSAWRRFDGQFHAGADAAAAAVAKPEPVLRCRLAAARSARSERTEPLLPRDAAARATPHAKAPPHGSAPATPSAGAPAPPILLLSAADQNLAEWRSGLKRRCAVRAPSRLDAAETRSPTIGPVDVRAHLRWHPKRRAGRSPRAAGPSSPTAASRAGKTPFENLEDEMASLLAVRSLPREPSNTPRRVLFFASLIAAAGFLDRAGDARRTSASISARTAASPSARSS